MVLGLEREARHLALLEAGNIKGLKLCTLPLSDQGDRISISPGSQHLGRFEEGELKKTAQSKNKCERKVCHGSLLWRHSFHPSSMKKDAVIVVFLTILLLMIYRSSSDRRRRKKKSQF